MADNTAEAQEPAHPSKANLLPIAKRKIFGLAEDFWADGPENLLNFNLKSLLERTGLKAKKYAIVPESERLGGIAHPRPRSNASQFDPNGVNNNWQWHALSGEISEKMFGEGHVVPAAIKINHMLISPLGLTKENSVLDLSAGLGTTLRQTVDETGAYMTGLEPDPDIAKRGMDLSTRAGKAKHAPIDHYDPSKLNLSRSYDCILARESFYRAPDQKAFFAAIAKSSKKNAQLAFTDYIIDPAQRENPVITAWLAHETAAHPLSKEEMDKMWAEVRFTLRVHEDLTEMYKKEIMTGMKKLLGFLASGQKPDKETLIGVLRRIETWKFRLNALNAGLKFCRFYGTKS